MKILNPKPIEKLDEVLHILWVYSELNQAVCFGDIFEKMNIGFDNIKSSELQQILRKLDKDGFIDIIPGESVRYLISFEGVFLYYKGGYDAQYTQEMADKIESQNLKTLEMRLKERVLVQNRWLIGIGLIAAIYYLLEIGKFLHQSHPYFLCCGVW